MTTSTTPAQRGSPTATDEQGQGRREQDARILAELSAREHISQDVDRVRDRVEMAQHEALNARQQAQQARGYAQQAQNASRQAGDLLELAYNYQFGQSNSVNGNAIAGDSGPAVSWRDRSPHLHPGFQL